MKKIMLFAVISIVLGMSIMARAGTQYNWGTNTGANWITPDNTQIQVGQALVIGSTTPYPSVITSSSSVVGLGGFLLTQINAMLPNALGQIVYCYNCVATPVCVSSGTGALNSFVSISSVAVACR